MAAKNAFALLRLQDGEEPEKALENNVEKYKQDMEQAKIKAKAPKHEKAPAKEANQKPRNDKPRKEGEQRERRAPRESNGERRAPRESSGRGPRRDGEPIRRDDGAKHRERPEGKGNRAPRRENDRKSASGKRPQDDKRREESKLNLGKADQAETDAAIDVEAEKKEDDEAAAEAEEPEEPKEKSLTLAEYKALANGQKATVKRKAGEGEDQSKFKSGEVLESTDFMEIVDSSAVAANAKSKKGNKKPKDEKKTVDLKLNFYQHDKGDERPPRREQRESRAPGSERGAPREDRRSNGSRRDDNRRQPSNQQKSQRAPSGRAPDFSNDAAFPALG